MQYYGAVEPDTVGNWPAVPADGQNLIDMLGDTGLTGMSADAEVRMSGFVMLAEAIHRHFMLVADQTKSHRK